jgi:Bifunctional DNA primase/polymerase, N-terminal
LNNLESVLRYAANGWQIFPIKPKAKEPATRRGFYDATTNPATLQRWFARYSYNVGVRTGTASGIFVLDIDGDAGVASLRDLESEHGPLPQTLTAITTRGQHFWFLLNVPLPSSQSKIGNGLDVKADSGYVVAPFSQHPNGKIYRWADDSIPLATPPDWLTTLARKRRAADSENENPGFSRERSQACTPGNYGRAALDREITTLAAAAPGARNEALNLSAFRLGQLVGGGELNRSEVETALNQACETNGLGKDDGWHTVKRTIASGIGAGLQHPRTRWGTA